MCHGAFLVLAGAGVPLTLLLLGLLWRPVVLAVLGGWLLVLALAGRRVRAGPAWHTPGARVTVGGGWSAVLQRRALGTRVAYAPSGPLGGKWWRAGTTIAEVQRALRAKGRTLAGHPSIEGATLGGWVATGSHGNGGTLWQPSLGRVRVREADGTERVLASKREVRAGTHVVLAVEVHAVADAPCDRVAFDVADAATAVRFLEAPSYLRVLFVDARSALAFLWTPPDEEASPPRRCGVVPPWLAVLLPRNACLPRARWHARTTLARANAFAPEPPLLLAVPCMLAFLNYELVVPGLRLDSPLLLALVAALHRACSGGARCEIRCGRDVAFFDVAAPRATHDPAAVAAALAPLLRDRPVRLHPGKATRVNLAPLRVVGGTDDV